MGLTGGISLDPENLWHGRLRAIGRYQLAAPGRVVEKTMKGTLDTIAHKTARAERYAAMRAEIAHAGDLITGVAPEDELLAHPRDTHRLRAPDFARFENGVPLIADHGSLPRR